MKITLKVGTKVMMNFF